MVRSGLGLSKKNMFSLPNKMLKKFTSFKNKSVKKIKKSNKRRASFLPKILNPGNKVVKSLMQVSNRQSVMNKASKYMKSKSMKVTRRKRNMRKSRSKK